MTALARDPRFEWPIGVDLDWQIECWAQRLIARSILYSDGVLDLHTAADGAWFAAEAVGLVDIFGPDEIQACLSLVFGAARC